MLDMKPPTSPPTVEITDSLPTQDAIVENEAILAIIALSPNCVSPTVAFPPHSIESQPHEPVVALVV